MSDENEREHDDLFEANDSFRGVSLRRDQNRVQDEEDGEDDIREDSQLLLQQTSNLKLLYLLGKKKLGLSIPDEFEEAFESAGGAGISVDGEVKTPEERFKNVVSPDSVNFESSTMAKVGDDHVVSAFTSEFPTEPEDLFLRDVLGNPEVRSDMTIHLSPYDEDEAVDFLRLNKSNLKDSLAQFGGEASRQRYRNAEQMLSAVQTSRTRLFDVSMRASARGKTETEVASSWDTLKSKLTSSPARTDQKRATYVQDRGFRSTSPIGKDYIENKSQMLSGGVAAMLPFASSTVIEEGGVNYGIHGSNGSPVFVNRFERPGGFNQLTIGSIGSGKSFSAKLHTLRQYSARRDDVIVITIDPLQGFKGFTQALGGEIIKVGGSKGVNPMEIRKPGEEETKRLKKEDGADPLGTKIDDVVSFFSSYYRQEGLELGDKKSTLGFAVREAYKRCGITRDIETHDNESPTIEEDLIGVLRDMAQEPESYVDDAVEEDEAESLSSRLREDAQDIITDLRPFQEGGRYGMIGTGSDVDLQGSDMILLDIPESGVDEDQGLIMRLLFTLVYERAKQTDKKVILNIDEAHVLMKDRDTLSMLTRVVRHSRHFDMSINFITQQPDDFFQSFEDGPDSKTIAENCTMKLILKVDNMSKETADAIGLNERLRQASMELKSGKNSRGKIFGSNYSTSLFYVDPIGWIPLSIVPSLPETVIVDREEPLSNKEEVRQFINRVVEKDRTTR